MRKYITSAAAFLIAVFSANAQNIKVSGTVSDAMGPVAGAAVLIQGTTTGVVTELNGAYAIDAPANAVLEVSCIGYTTVVVEAANNMSVTLKDDALLLEEELHRRPHRIPRRKRNLRGSLLPNLRLWRLHH